MMDSLIRSSIALNNCGVSLLEKGRAKQAVNFLQTILRVLGKPISKDSQSQIHAELVRAEKLVACRQSKTRSLSDVVSVDSDDDAAMQSAIRYGSSSTVVYPMRLRCAAPTELEGLATFLYIKATIRYNLGIAGLCCFRDDCQRTNFLISAEKSFSTALDYLRLAVLHQGSLYHVYQCRVLSTLISHALEPIARTIPRVPPRGLRPQEHTTKAQNDKLIRTLWKEIFSSKPSL